MRRSHFEALRPVCPVCRSIAYAGAPAGSDGWPLAVTSVDRGEGDVIVEGLVRCSNLVCQREYPIIDGVPFLIAPLRHYLAENMLALYARDDLSAQTESLVGDCCGTGSTFDTMRQHVSSYAWDHYGDLDPDEPAGEPRPGACMRMLEQGLALAGPLPPGPILDAGCAAGRTSLALATATGALVVGVDLFIPTLRLASRVVRDGVVSYPRRRVGLVYDRRTIAVDLPGRERVEIWACDATALPFASGTFAATIGLNVVDSVVAPVELLCSLARVLAPGGALVVSSPYEWSPHVTPVEAWIGGHSQRGTDGGSSAEVLRQVLTPGALPSSIDGLAIVAERDRVPWHVRLHDRSVASYQSHLVVARKAAPRPGA